MPGIFDHLFMLIMMIVIPLHSKFAFPALLEDIKRRGEPALLSAYRQIIATFATAGAVALAIWYWHDRDWASLGFQWGDAKSQLIAFTLAALLLAAIVLPIRKLAIAIESGSSDGSTFEQQSGDLGLFMPKSRREEAWFMAVSVNAGITEELIFRAYLIWYLQYFIGAWPAAILAVLLFGFAHIYQGLAQLPGILLVSSVAVMTYVISGSLLVPIIMHIVVDAFQGHYIARIKRGKATTPST